MSEALPVSGNTTQTAPENRAFYPALDGLRAVSFLLVFLTHYMATPWAWCGVNFFFVLSGFLITGILFDTRHAAHRVRNFYVRRTLRIFPLYYGVLLCFLFTFPVFHWIRSWKYLLWATYLGNVLRGWPAPPGSVARALADLAPVGSFHGTSLTLFLGHFWSLCIEEQFYLIWPWVVFALKDRRKLLWICGLSLPVDLGLRLLAQRVCPPWIAAADALARITPLSCDGLLLGGFLALLLRGPARQRALAAGRWLLPIALLLCLGWLLRHDHHDATGQYIYPAQTGTYGFTVLNLLGGLLLLVALQPQTSLFKVLNLRPLRWAGRLSYGAYIFHDIFHSVLVQLTRPHDRLGRLSFYVGSLFFTYLLAWLSFRFYETPFLNLKDRWTVKARASSPSSQAPPTYA